MSEVDQLSSIKAALPRQQALWPIACARFEIMKRWTTLAWACGSGGGEGPAGGAGGAGTGAV